jgi:DNA-binding transcriptional ArsR family regulator
MSELHPEVTLDALTVRVDGMPIDLVHDVKGTGLLLVPCVFAWPCVVVDPGRLGTPRLVYGPRGVRTLWDTDRDVASSDTLAVLLGRGRAAVLSATALPQTTTDLARFLGMTPPSVSAHLSTLRRSGLLVSRRAGRRVLYEQTVLARTLIAAGEEQRSNAPGAA